MSLLSFLRSLYSWFYPGKDDERHPSPIYTAQEDNESYYSPPIRRHTQERFKKLYRLLRADERRRDGLEANDEFSSIDVVTHVAYGSKGQSSKYISTCADLDSATDLRDISYFKGKIVSIRVNRLPDSVRIIPLTTYKDRMKHVKTRHDKYTLERYHNFASRFEEDFLVGYVPPECLSVVEL